MFSADTVNLGRIEGHWTEYRRVLAQIRVHDLFAALRIRLLAVNRLLQCADGLVLGRREPGSVFQPGVWQGPSAGSVERRVGPTLPDQGGAVDLAGQILAGCQEELGLGAADVLVQPPLVAVEHGGSHIVDIGLLLRTRLAFAQIQAAWIAAATGEYDQQRRLDLPQPLAAADAAGLALAPCTRAIPKRFRSRQS